MSLRLSPRRAAAIVALAVLSLGGLHAANASTQGPARPLTPSNPVTTSASELYSSVTPCRLVDTRIVGGHLTGTARSFDVSGSLSAQGGASTCGIPAHATSIAVNLTGIVDPSGGGFVRGWAAGGSVPTATLLNYGEEINVSNMVNIPLCRGGTCTDAFTLRNFGSNVHIVADVLGYYRHRCSPTSPRSEPSATPAASSTSPTRSPAPTTSRSTAPSTPARQR